MTYYVDLFSPKTYEAFKKSSQAISGFRKSQEAWAKKVKPGDIFVCYITKVSRWCGLLKVTSDYFVDNSPIFVEKDDPFSIRFQVKKIVWLEPDHAIPIHEDEMWDTLTFTKGQEKNSKTWTGRVRASLSVLRKKDGAYIEYRLLQQADLKTVYPLQPAEKRKFSHYTVQRFDGAVTVTVPDDEQRIDVAPKKEVRESIQIQALLAQLGSKIGGGHKIWIPANDRAAVLKEWPGGEEHLLGTLPLNYNDTTLETIERIDVLWLKGRTIVRAFEVEHTTVIYSGILRMADLLALQPNIDIRLHIVAPEERKDKVFSEIQRPVFSLLERKPLAECCTFLSYENLREVEKLKHLEHMTESVLEDYEERAE